jgi:hypothetical protein
MGSRVAIATNLELTPKSLAAACWKAVQRRRAWPLTVNIVATYPYDRVDRLFFGVSNAFLSGTTCEATTHNIRTAEIFNEIKSRKDEKKRATYLSPAVLEIEKLEAIYLCPSGMDGIKVIGQIEFANVPITSYHLKPPSDAKSG